MRIVTHAPFQPLVAERGLAFVPLDGNPNELFLRPELRSALTYDGNPLRSARASLRYLQAARPLFQRMLMSAWQGCQGADALLVTLPTTWGDQIAEALGIPCVWALTQPLGRTGAFPSPLLPLGLSLGATYNRLTHAAIEQVVWQPWRGLLGRWRRETLGLPRLRSIGWEARTAARGDLFLYGFSPRVAARPTDWPARFHVTGYWFLDAAPGWQPAAELLDFLAGGEPPLYVGFGSTGAESDASLLAIVARALALAGRRAILSVGERDRRSVDLPPGVLPIDAVPHDWLFPRLAAVVHHGGVGTTAAALRAGIPAVCVPFGTDQLFWARQIAALGCAPPPLPRRALSAERLAAAIAAVGAPPYRARAAALAALIGAERGVERAVALIQSHLR
ncbi:MAG: glycosyltransferase family 1 protein [Kouleothrix sp.]|nr:glycosyltransferase family 1 protein [Kouleothrix sp.]